MIEKMATEKTATEKTATEKMATEKMATENVALGDAAGSMLQASVSLAREVQRQPGKVHRSMLQAQAA